MSDQAMANQIQAIRGKAVQDVDQINRDEYAELGKLQNDHALAVARAMFWEQKRRDVNTAASEKINQLLGGGINIAGHR
jgi:hypothetical protein